MQIKKAVPYIVGIAMLFGIGYQQKQISDLTSRYESQAKEMSALQEKYRSLSENQSEADDKTTSSLNAMHNSIVLGLGYVDSNGKRITELEKTQSHMREMDKETRRAVGILARDSKRTNSQHYPLTEKYSLNNW